MIKPIVKLIPKNSKFAIGVSGGSDSLAVLLYFWNRGYNISAFHINNHLIPQDELTESKVREFCNRYLIPLYVYSCKNKYIKGSKEAFCRAERHEGFKELSVESGIKDIVLAHNLDDCKASYLFDILRGHEGRIPIPLFSNFEGYKVIRPFILTPKNDLKSYLKSNNAFHFVIEDELNNDVSLTRNFLNKQVIPLIESKKHFNLGSVVKKKILEKVKSL